MALRISLMVMLLMLAGCQAPWPQLPSLYPRSPEAERASFSQHDPLPDSSLGPSVNGRPREAFTQRGEPRRTLEAAMPSMTQGGNPATMQPAPSEYPQTIIP